MNFKYFMPPLKTDSNQLEQAIKVIAQSKLDELDQLKDTLISCTTDSEGKSCGAMQSVRETQFIEKLWYVPPWVHRR